MVIWIILGVSFRFGTFFVDAKSFYIFKEAERDQTYGQQEEAARATHIFVNLSNFLSRNSRVAKHVKTFCSRPLTFYHSMCAPNEVTVRWVLGQSERNCWLMANVIVCINCGASGRPPSPYIRRGMEYGRGKTAQRDAIALPVSNNRVWWGTRRRATFGRNELWFPVGGVATRAAASTGGSVGTGRVATSLHAEVHYTDMRRSLNSPSVKKNPINTYNHVRQMD